MFLLFSCYLKSQYLAFLFQMEKTIPPPIWVSLIGPVIEGVCPAWVKPFCAKTYAIFTKFLMIGIFPNNFFLSFLFLNGYYASREGSNEPGLTHSLV